VEAPVDKEVEGRSVLLSQHVKKCGKSSTMIFMVEEERCPV